MKTIKCHNCGCIMGEHSERCPQCGTVVGEKQQDENTNDNQNYIEDSSEGSDDIMYESIQMNEEKQEIKDDADYNNNTTYSKTLVYSIIILLFFLGIYIFITNYRHSGSNEDIIKNEETEETVDSLNAVQNIVERVKTIFYDVPDHCFNVEEVNSKIFSEEFYYLVKESMLLDEEMHNLSSDYEIGDETVVYWYLGQDDCVGCEINKIDILNQNETTIDVMVIYGGDQHQLKLIYENQEWVLDDWDGKKGILKKNNKEIAQEVKILKLPFVKLLNWEKSKLDDGYSCEYFLYDITKDGIPELWLKTGSCEADLSMNVYTINGNGVKQIINESSGHIIYYQGPGYVIREYEHMGYLKREKIIYDNNGYRTELIYEYSLLDENGDYIEKEEITDATAIEFHSSDDIKPILDAFLLD